MISKKQLDEKRSSSFGNDFYGMETYSLFNSLAMKASFLWIGRDKKVDSKITDPQWDAGYRIAKLLNLTHLQ